MTISPRLTTVTRVSRYLAFIIFITLPFIFGYIGYEYGKQTTQPPVIISAPVGSDTAPTPDITITDSVIEDKNDFYAITARYPDDNWDTEHVVQSFVEARVAAKQTEWAIGGEAYQSEQAVAAEFPDRPKVIYTLDIRYASTSSEKLGTRTYTFFESEMTGGANGNVTVTTFTFNNNGVVTLEDILNIQDGNDIAITKLIRNAAIVQQPDVFSNVEMLDDGLGLTNLDENGIFDAEKCQCDGYFFGSNLQNFIPTDIGMNFIFSKFAITPGVAMTPEVSLTWNELTPYLKPAYTK